jgi:hypothetical protein
MLIPAAVRSAIVENIFTSLCSCCMYMHFVNRAAHPGRWLPAIGVAAGAASIGRQIDLHQYRTGRRVSRIDAPVGKRNNSF